MKTHICSVSKGTQSFTIRMFQYGNSIMLKATSLAFLISHSDVYKSLPIPCFYLPKSYCIWLFDFKYVLFNCNWKRLIQISNFIFFLYAFVFIASINIKTGTSEIIKSVPAPKQPLSSE